jgi:DNA-binding transcriptional LysR family regulator
MSLNSAYLDAFYSCARLGHFTRAARQLSITQSALSQRIKNLEEELGTTLIMRERSGLRLTEAGQRLLRYCQQNEHAERETLGDIQGGADGLSGIIRIGGYSSVMRSVILPALAPVLTDHPQLQLQSYTRELYELQPMLKSGQIDFMVFDEHSKKDGLVSHVLGYETYVEVKQRGYMGAEIYLDHDEDDLTTARFIGKKSNSGIQRRYLDDIYGILDGVRLGLGKAIVPMHLISGSSEFVTNGIRSTKNPVVLQYAVQPYYSKLHTAVVGALEQHVKRFLLSTKKH